MVYFIHALISNRLKCGKANNVESRFNYLLRENADDLTLLGSIPGDEEVEQAIHAELDAVAERIHNEFWDFNRAARLVVDRYLYADRGVTYEPETLPDSEAPESEVLSVSEQVQPSEFD